MKQMCNWLQSFTSKVSFEYYIYDFKNQVLAIKTLPLLPVLKEKKSYVIWIFSQILDLLSIHSMGEGTIPQTNDDQMDNVRTSLSCVFQFVKVWPLMCHYKGHL